jgi:hypothetical protein
MNAAIQFLHTWGLLFASLVLAATLLWRIAQTPDRKALALSEANDD